MTAQPASPPRQPRQWTFLRNATDLADTRQAVERADALGYHGIMVPQIFAPPWATLAAAAACSERIELASGIALAFVRSPFETAMAALDLDRLSGGRFTLGIGTSVADWNENRFGVPYERPLAKLRELVPLLRRLVTADAHDTLGRIDGEFWQLDLRNVQLPRPLRHSIPITVAPLRPKMTELAAELADGILGHPVWCPRWIATGVRDAIDRGLQRAGRDRSELRVTAMLRVAITDDITAGRHHAKVGLPMYAALRQYQSYFEALDLGEEAAHLQDLADTGASGTELAAAVPDHMADELVLIGPPDEINARITGILDVVDDLCLSAPAGLPADITATYEQRIVEHLLDRTTT